MSRDFAMDPDIVIVKIFCWRVLDSNRCPAGADVLDDHHRHHISGVSVGMPTVGPDSGNGKTYVGNDVLLCLVGVVNGRNGDNGPHRPKATYVDPLLNDETLCGLSSQPSSLFSQAFGFAFLLFLPPLHGPQE